VNTQNKTGKILVIYFHSLGFPMRKTNEQMLYCFERFSNHLVYFLNLAFPPPENLLQVHFDLVIFHDLLLCKRSLPRRFDRITKYAQPLKQLKGYRIATVQDEFTQTALLNDFLVEFDIRHIFSVAPPSEWEKIYPKLDHSKVKFDFCLTGYLDDHEITRIQNLEKQAIKRVVDIGYRATPIRHSLGYIGYLKVQITDVFQAACKDLPLNINLSNDPKDTFLGDAWYNFLLSCKYTLGVESGASVLDKDGSVDKRVQDYLQLHPQASFEEVQAACFAELDGQLQLQVVGPRHLEACLTKTCQILTEGDYNGILKPFVHYIPVKKDFSNVAQVLELVAKDELRGKLVENAYRDIVQTGHYSFAAYVKKVLTSSLGESYTWSAVSSEELAIYSRNAKREARVQAYVKTRTKIINAVLKRIPTKTFKILEGFMKKH
jgi:hypothetical protein